MAGATLQPPEPSSLASESTNALPARGAEDKNHSNMNRFTHLLMGLGINSVPAAGWFFAEWSAGTTLAVYWFENILSSLLVAARIAIHQRTTPKAGHFRYKAKGDAGKSRPRPLLGGFLRMSLMFSAAHGVFLATIFAVLAVNGHGADVSIDATSLTRGCLIVTVLLTVNFLVDLPRISQRSFLWAERLVDVSFGRITVVHLTLILGMAAVAFTGLNRAFFGVFFVLKTLCDLSFTLPQWDPKVPPRWLCRLMDAVPNVHPGQSFEQFWIAERKAEVARRAANELPRRNAD